MKFGCCGSMIDPEHDPIGIDRIEKLEEIGYDYIELSLRDIMKLSDADFLQLERRVSRSGLRCEACNNFMPPDLKVTGPGVDTKSVLNYVENAFERAGRLGAEVIVFGSPLSRDIDLDFSRETAVGQMVGILRLMGSIAEKYHVTVAMEHVNRIDGNLLTSVSEALELVRRVNHPKIQLLVDYFHLSIEKESVNSILSAGSSIRHIHFARLYKRLYPKDLREDPNYVLFFENLKKIGYQYRISVEAVTDQFEKDAKETLTFLRHRLG